MPERMVSVGDQFTKLTVIEKIETPKKSGKWKCRCACGSQIDVYERELVQGLKKSCGCMKSPDRTGQRYGLLTVIGRSDKRAPRGKRTVPLWECKCDCGAIVYKAMDTLTNPDRCSCQNCANRLNSKKSRECAGFYQGTQLTKLMKTEPAKGNESGRRGVSRDKKTGKWRAQITFRRQRIHLGYFEKKEDAVRARIRAEEIYFAPVLEQAGAKK